MIIYAAAMETFLCHMKIYHTPFLWCELHTTIASTPAIAYDTPWSQQ